MIKRICICVESSVFLFLLFRADFDDSATYSAVASNVHGQASTNCAVVVRSKSYFMIKTRNKYDALVIECSWPIYSQGSEGMKSLTQLG